MARRLLCSFLLIAAAISVVGSAAVATENVVESSKVHTKKDEHKVAQAIVDDIDTSFKAEPKAVKKKLNNVELESTIDDNTATISTTESPWTSFDIPSWLLKTRDFYKIDKFSSDDGKWSTIANAKVCSKFGTSSIHVTLSNKKKNRSLIINYRSDVFDDTTSTSGDYWYLTIIDGDDTTKVAVSVGKRHSYKLQKIIVNGEKVLSLLTFRGVVGDGGGISSSTKSLLRDGLKAASDMNIFSTLPGDGKMGDMYDKFVNDLIREDTSGMGGGGGGEDRQGIPLLKRTSVKKVSNPTSKGMQEVK